MDYVWTVKWKRRQANEAKLKRPVPTGWTDDNSTAWEVPRSKSYSGPEGGGPHGPTQAVLSCVTLVALFCFSSQCYTHSIT